MTPYYRPRRLRENSKVRDLVQETRLSPAQLVFPIFVGAGSKADPIPSMPGQYRYPVEELPRQAERLLELGIPAVLLFGVPDDSDKDSRGSSADADDGVTIRALQTLHANTPELLLMADVCLCEYTDHGHCGFVHSTGAGYSVDNDTTIQRLAEVSVAYAQAGADIIAPSDMMDGRVGAIRQALDQNGHETTPILSYAAKYASAFYGPFRDAAGSAPQRGDRKSYQMNPANWREALREVELDIEEGADLILVKPAMPCLDIVTQVRERVELPVGAYQVSGEYSALCAAGEKGWLDLESVMLESLLVIARAGADFILTYFAREAAPLLSRS